MYGDFSKLEEMKKKLDEVSPSFCMAKWMHTTLHLLNGETHSCYLPPPHRIPPEELEGNPSALHNTSEKKDQRKMMLRGERPKGCFNCWKVEDLPGNRVSDRHLRAVESWTLPYFERVRQMTGDENVNPSYLEVSFSNACNLKCSYCSPHISSKWESEVREFGPYQLSDKPYLEFKHLPMPIRDEENNPYLRAFWEWMPELYPGLMHLRVTGGEPLLSQHTFKLFDWVLKEPNPNLNFSINSNFCLPDKMINRFFKRLDELYKNQSIQSFELHSSVDTFGVQAEYIRHGFDFDLFEKNIRRYLSEFEDASLAFMCTFNLLSVVGFQRFLQWVKDLRQDFSGRMNSIHLDIPHLVYPYFMNVRILPESYQSYMEECLEYMRAHPEDLPAKIAGFRPNEIKKMERILETMRDRPDNEWGETARRNFYLFFTQHDERRNTDFLQAFPEMKEFWEQCRKSWEEHKAAKAIEHQNAEGEHPAP